MTNRPSAPECPNLAALLAFRVRDTPDRTALRFRHGEPIVRRTWTELAREVHQVATGLLAQGIRPGDRVAQLSENRWEWIVADLAILSIGAIHVPIHAPLAAPQVQFQIAHSGARAVFVSQAQQQAKLLAVADHLPRDLIVIHYDERLAELARWPCQALVDWWKLDPTPGKLASAETIARTEPTALATLIYTSGTTGQAKGVMLEHVNLVSNALSTSEAFGMVADDVRLCFLPLSHIFARTCDLYTWIGEGYRLDLATTRESVLADCQWSQPTILSGVPYFFDRCQRVLREQGIEHRPGALRDLLGGRIRYACSGGAALPNHTYDYFHTQNVPILQGYGLTETSPVISLSSPRHVRRGASGRALPNVEIQSTDEGELITRGPHVMRGYWNDRESTAAVLRDGWFHTGDLGHVDEDGYVWITGRKKELIVTAAGKNIAPVLLESLLTEDPLIEQALVIGDGRNYLTALLVLQWEAVRSQLPQLTLDPASDEARRAPEILALLRQVIDQRLACLSHHEQIRRFTILDRPFSIEQGEMTAKLSLRRPIIEERFAASITAMYDSRRDSTTD